MINDKHYTVYYKIISISFSKKLYFSSSLSTISYRFVQIINHTSIIISNTYEKTSIVNPYTESQINFDKVCL